MTNKTPAHEPSARSPWTVPLHRAVDVNGAARILGDFTANDSRSYSVSDLDEAFSFVQNWRDSHAFPLNTFQVTLRRKAKEIYSSALVAQRLKRLPSILGKLVRFPDMKLSQMQDIGGCRAVLRNVGQVRALRSIYKKSALKHHFMKEVDYVGSPRDSGYRGIHLIYRYYSDRNETFNDLKIEMQFRSRFQHAWATAVETVDGFSGQALKSSQGSHKWLRVFALMGSVLAKTEKTPAVPGTPTKLTELRREIKELADELRVEENLRNFGLALKVLAQPTEKEAKYYLLHLEPNGLKIYGFRQGEIRDATKRYIELERSAPNGIASRADVVLVSVDKLASLKGAFPNYFSDTTVFIQTLKDTIGR